MHNYQKALEHGIDINKRDDKGNTTLFYALENKSSIYNAKLLLKNGADVNVMNFAGKKTSAPGETPLFCAVRQGNKQKVELLLKYGADANGITHRAKNKEIPAGGTLPVIVAATNNRSKIVKILVKKGADINGRDSDDSTALIEICRKKISGKTKGAIAFRKCRLFKLLPLLIKLGADIDAEDGDGNTALMVAASKGDYDMVVFLLKHGAALKNKQGQQARGSDNHIRVNALFDEAVTNV